MKATCTWCGKEFDREMSWLKHGRKKGWKTCCSTKCRNEYTIAKRKGIGPNRVMVQCPVCGKVFTPTLGKWKEAQKGGWQKKCSRSCNARWRDGQRYAGKLMTPRLIENMKVN